MSAVNKELLDRSRVIPAISSVSEPAQLTGRGLVPVVMMGVLELWKDCGASIHMRELVLGLIKQGFCPWVICLSSPISLRKEIAIKELPVPVLRKRFLLQISWNLLATARAIDAVRRSGSKVIYTRLDPGMFAAMFAAIITRTKLVVEMNGLPTLDLELYRPNNRFLLMISRQWENMHYRFATFIVGAPGYARYVERHFRVKNSKLLVTPLGVNTELFSPMEQMDALRVLDLENRSTIVWVGTIAGWQGLETLLHAAVILQVEVKGCLVIVVGDGPCMQELQKLSNQLGLNGTIRFVGKVPYHLVPLYVGASKVCVCTFPGNRGEKHSISALKTLNYLACGRPVVTTDMDEVAVDIVRAEAGLSVEPDDANQLASSLAEILCEDLTVWRKRCFKARELISQTRSWDAIAARIGQLLRNLK
jgi:glycosyltransferase involved in cell wall biosynthesis